MKYKKLSSIYYQNEAEYVAEYNRRITGADCVKIDFQIGKNQAFFLRNCDIYEMAFEIARLDKDILRLSHALPDIAIEQYGKKCLIDEIVITNKIEGVHSSRREIGDALAVLERQSEKKGKKMRFEGLVNRYFKLSSNEKLSLNSCEDIRKIYDEIVLDEVVGEDKDNSPDGVIFRKDAVSVHSVSDTVIHNGLYPESRIIEAVEKTLNFLKNESVEKLFRICICHYLLEYIHPFYDGNGRLGRFILSSGLAEELTPLIAFRISETIKNNIKEYYDAFKICNDEKNLGDVTPFLYMQLRLILLSMQELKESLEERKLKLDKYDSFIRKMDISKEQKELYRYLLQAALFGENGIPKADLITNMKSSDYHIKKLMLLAPKGLIVELKKGHFKYYLLDLNVLNDIISSEEK